MTNPSRPEALLEQYIKDTGSIPKPKLIRNLIGWTATGAAASTGFIVAENKFDFFEHFDATESLGLLILAGVVVGAAVGTLHNGLATHRYISRNRAITGEFNQNHAAALDEELKANEEDMFGKRT